MSVCPPARTQEEGMWKEISPEFGYILLITQPPSGCSWKCRNDKQAVQMLHVMLLCRKTHRCFRFLLKMRALDLILDLLASWCRNVCSTTRKGALVSVPLRDYMINVVAHSHATMKWNQIFEVQSKVQTKLIIQAYYSLTISELFFSLTYFPSMSTSATLKAPRSAEQLVIL